MKNDETERRVYWAAQLDEAHDFMMRVMDYPVEECGERLISLPDTVDEANVEVYYSERPHVNLNQTISKPLSEVITNESVARVFQLILLISILASSGRCGRG